MNDTSAFDDFINGLDLPDSHGDSSTPPDDIDLAAEQYSLRIRAMIRAIISRTGHLGPDAWSENLTDLQLLVRNELLNNIAAKAGTFDNMSKEDVAMNAGYTLITFAWHIFGELVRELAPPDEDEPDTSSQIPF